jgi:hypothetical protein
MKIVPDLIRNQPIKIIKLSHAQWSNLIAHWASECEQDFNLFSFRLATSYIVENILESMASNKVEFIEFANHLNECIRVGRNIDELLMHVEDELGYQLRAKLYPNNNPEIIDLSKNITTEMANIIILSHSKWADWINSHASNFPLKINFSTFISAIDYIAENIFEDMDMHNIDILSFIDCNGKNISIQKNKDEIFEQVEIELSHQLDPKYGKI